MEGQNLRIEYRYADNDFRKLNRLAEDLVRAKVLAELDHLVVLVNQQLAALRYPTTLWHKLVTASLAYSRIETLG